MTERALVLADGYFGTPSGKTANGLVRYSRRYAIVGVIDRTRAGRDAGEVLDGVSQGIPIVGTLREGIERLRPGTLIVGVATFGGYIPQEFRPVIREAIQNGLNVVAGLHEHLADDPEFAALAAKHGVRLVDVRKPRPLRELLQFSDLARKLPCLRLAVLGTDGAIGKRTTAILLTEALNAAGVTATFVATGQTGLLQGADYGVPIDAITGDFMVGELEGEIVRGYEETKPQVIVVEGQGSISHPAYVCGTRAICMAAMPQAIVLQHAPARKIRRFRQDVVSWPMPTVGDEIRMLELFSPGKVVAITLNHEDMSREHVDATVREYEATFKLPTCDPLWHGVDKVVAAVRARL
ncbi:MAG: DUF1611 domain-containing protein [Euryarchaeota archaeon]|nr:DUF1611 domain-containing protein [Euryarchaeota archaeon]